MFDVAAHLDAIYDTLGLPVTPVAGEPFRGIFRVNDVEVFDAPRVGDYTLRFPSALATLQRGDEVGIAGQQYWLAEVPRRIGDGSECEVQLVRGGA